MLPPDNRHVLLDLLRPPLGGRLAHAVATTFTLDLTAALVAPLAFASQRLHGKQDPVAIMEAVRGAADRVDVFCQSGHVRIPARHSDLMAFLEGAIHEVVPPRPGRLFHPKLWALLFESDEGDSLRLVVATRNLTDDVSWDVAVRLDGVIDSRPHARNAPLAGFIRNLPAMARDSLPPERVQRIENLAETLRYAVWDSLPPAGEPTFHVFGVEGLRRSSPDFTGYRHLIVSPFVNDGGLDVVAPTSRGSTVTLVSRPEQMEQLETATVQRLSATRIVSPLAGLTAAGEDKDEDAASLGVTSGPSVTGSLLGGGLHAKLYVVERNRAAHVFVGSANATEAAFDGNVEVLVEFSAGAAKFGVDTFLGQTSGMAELLEDYLAVGGAEADPKEDAQAQLENVLRRVASLRWSLTVEAVSEPYTLHAQVRGRVGLDADTVARIALLTQPARARDFRADHEVKFANVPLADVTPFLIVSLSREIDGIGRLEANTVVRARLVKDPAGRLDAVLARQVDTPEKFLRFLLLLLGLEDRGGFEMSAAGDGAGSWSRAGRLGTLEAILRALAEHPSAIDELDRLVVRLRRTEEGSRILPEGFDTVWDQVLAARRRLPSVLTKRAAR
jgi:hypothetical protein